MKKPKTIKFKSKGNFQQILYALIIRDTNSKLISLEISRKCRKFIKELEETYLSEELQAKPKKS